MRGIILCVAFSVLCIHWLEAKDFVVGSRINNLLISTEKIFHRSMPFITKDKDYIYTDPNKRIIKCIIARDLSATDTDVTVTAGGVGDTHVTLHFRGERGGEIRYLVFIFSCLEDRCCITTASKAAY